MASRRPEQVFAAAVAVYGLLSPVICLPHQGFAVGQSVGAFVALYAGAALYLTAPLLLLLLWGWLFRNGPVLAACALIAVELAVMNPILIRRDLLAGHSARAFIAMPLQEAALALLLGGLFGMIILMRRLRAGRRGRRAEA